MASDAFEVSGAVVTSGAFVVSGFVVSCLVSNIGSTVTLPAAEAVKVAPALYSVPFILRPVNTLPSSAAQMG